MMLAPPVKRLLVATMRIDRPSADIDDAALDALVELDPRRSGRDNVRLRDHGHHVWAIIDYMHGRNWDIDRTKADWDLSDADVRAAIRYYEKHRDLIEARILLENESHRSWRGATCLRRRGCLEQGR
ncbi:MAG: hypothetical protein QOF73_2944 [Thermomicrobiales bacterium]|nr:hypothetical protein [Thermomicrobiales bacterium]